MSDWIRKLDLAPLATTFVPPPSGQVTIKAMAQQTLRYWSLVRLAWLSGYQVAWMIPGRAGALSVADAATLLDVRLEPVPEWHDDRTSTFDVEEHVVAYGNAHALPRLATIVRVDGAAHRTVAFGTRRTRLLTGRGTPGELGETARWLPVPGDYSEGSWEPSVAPGGLDAAIRWEAPLGNEPVLHGSYSYIRDGEWKTAGMMRIGGVDHLRMAGMPMSSGRITVIVTAIVDAPAGQWGSLLVFDTPQATVEQGRANLDLRMHPDGSVELYSQGRLSTFGVTESPHSPIVFGLSVDTASDEVIIFMMDRSVMMSRVRMMQLQSTLSSLYLSRSMLGVMSMGVLDIAYFRGDVDEDMITSVLSDLDAIYGVTGGRVIG